MAALADAPHRAREMVSELDETLFFEVFGNGMILRKIEKYLGYTDLKLCREVSNRFNSLILEETAFRSRTVVNIKPKTIEDSVLESWGWKIKAVRVFPVLPDRYEMRKDQSNGYLSKDLWMEGKMKTLYSKIADVDTLIFDEECLFAFFNSLICRASVPSIYDTLTATQMLVELRLSTDCLKVIAEEEVGAGKAEIREKVMEKISMLQVLEICVTSKHVSVIPSVSFRQLRNLKKLKITIGLALNFDSVAEPLEHDQVRRLVQLNQSQLEELDMVSMSNVLLNGMNLRKLKTIRIGVFPPHTASIITFLGTYKNQLEDVYLRIVEPVPDLVSNVLNGLNPQLRAMGFEIYSESLGFRGGMNALDRFVRLEEFYLALPLDFGNANGVQRNIESAHVLFNGLPTTLKKISILNPWEQPESALRITKIQILTNVTSLHLESFGHSLTDDALHAVFCNMIQLRELRICRASGITDAGFRGLVQVGRERIANPSFCIRNLKVEIANLGLVNLEIRECDLSDETVLDAIKFLELRYLDIDYNGRITDASFYGVLEHNPSLEQLLICNVFPASLSSKERVAAFVRNKYPRLKHCPAAFEKPMDKAVKEFLADLTEGMWDWNNDNE